MTDTVLKSTAIEILIENLGIINTERFIALINRESFNYTEWRRENLPDDISVEELSRQAEEYWRKTYPDTTD